VGGTNIAGLDLTHTSHTDAGTYAADAWSFHDSSGNYADASGKVDDLISQAQLTITANDKPMTLNGSLPTFDATYKGFVPTQNSGALNGTLTCSTTTNGKLIGSFPITCSGQSSTNYSITYKPGILSIQYAGGGICAGDIGHQILQPINAAGTSVFNSKSTTPAKFRVCDVNGVSIGTPGVVKGFAVARVLNGTVSDQNEAVDSTTPDSTFRWDPMAQQWIFNISNKSLSNSRTYGFLITLNDGSSISFQYGIK